MSVLWFIEDVHQRGLDGWRAAVSGPLVAWTEAHSVDRLPRVVREAERVVFHGSLAVAHALARHPAVEPGAFCEVDSLAFPAWARQVEDRLVSRAWVSSTVRELVDDTARVVGEVTDGTKVFVRPASPLKPFSGRLLDTENSLTADVLDHGYYYDDLDLPIVVAAPVRVGAEWRFVVVDGRCVAWSGYLADGRLSAERMLPVDVQALAAELASVIEVADPVYVLDLARVDGEARLVELNPFSGADLYGCDLRAVATAVEGL